MRQENKIKTIHTERKSEIKTRLVSFNEWSIYAGPHSQLNCEYGSPLHTHLTMKSVVAVDFSVPSLKKSYFFHPLNHCGGAIFNIIIRRSEALAAHTLVLLLRSSAKNSYEMPVDI